MSIWFLAVFLAAVATAAESGPPRGEPQQQRASVVVIGAGVAGLTVAATLQKTGKYNVTLLEAMDRIGGRTHTMRFPHGRHIEMGAEWVHGQKGNAVYELVEPLGLVQMKPDPPLRDEQAVLSSGQVLNETMNTLLWEFFNFVNEDPDDLGKNARSGSFGLYARKMLDLFLVHRELIWSQKFKEMMLDLVHRIFLALDSADNWYEISARDDGDQYKELDGSQDVTWKPPYGYSSLHQLILTGNVTEEGRINIPNWIKLNKEVMAINYTNATAVQVCTRDGSCYYADHVVFTPSLGVLKAKHDTLFDPPLSPKKQLTIRSLGFGTATKYYLEFSEPWWPSDYNAAFILWDDIEYDFNDPHWMYWRSNITREELQADLNGFPVWTRSVCNVFTIDSRSHPNMFRAWVTGPASKYLDDMEPEYISANVMKLIRHFVGPHVPGGAGRIPEPIEVYQSKWRSNPFTRGVYSFRTLEADKEDVWARDLEEPILASEEGGKPLVLFAGEATHPVFFSTVHGAYETGLREAKRIEDWHSGSLRSSAHLSAVVMFVCIAILPVPW